MLDLRKHVQACKFKRYNLLILHCLWDNCVISCADYNRLRTTFDSSSDSDFEEKPLLKAPRIDISSDEEVVRPIVSKVHSMPFIATKMFFMLTHHYLYSTAHGCDRDRKGDVGPCTYTICSLFFHPE